MADIQLYYGPGSVALAALIALEECGAKYEAHQIKLADGEQRRPDFLGINPRGQVPVLKVDATPVRENIGVLTYIAMSFPESRLLPFAQPLKMAKCYEMMSWFATNLHTAMAQIFRAERFTQDDAAKASVQNMGREKFRISLDQFDEWASSNDGQWLLGENISIADLLAPVTARWAKRLEIDLTAFPSFAALAERITERPVAKRALEREGRG